jgi:drug/metabolite transporter (DMT)-like permease
MTWFLVSVVVAATALGDLFQTIGMKQRGEIHDFRPGGLGRALAGVFRNRWVILSIASFAVSFFAFLALVSVAELSFAVPATAAAYVVETLLAQYVLKETVGRERWAGALLVTVGVVLISL